MIAFSLVAGTAIILGALLVGASALTVLGTALSMVSLVLVGVQLARERRVL